MSSKSHSAVPALDVASLRKPARLRRGDRVGVFAPSFPTAAWFPERFERSAKAIEESLGVEVFVHPQARLATGFSAGDRAVRSEALVELLNDRSIRAIFATIGGFNSAELLPALERVDLTSDCKAVVGYSDCTSLLLGLQALGSWTTFYGPTALVQFGEFPNPLEYTLRSMRDVLFEGRTPAVLQDADGWTNEFLDWGGTDWKTRARTLTPAPRQTWRPGKGEGVLFGGNIETLNFLIGTPYLRVPDDLVLFWEATEEEAFLPRVARALTHLDQTGVLSRVRAMLIGRSPDCRAVREVTFRDVVMEATAKYSFPIVADLPFGHTDPMTMLPIGVRTTVDATTKDPAEIVFVEAAVS